MPRYVTTAQYKTWARNSKPTDDDQSISDALEAAEVSLDNACGRKFVVAGAATARLYRPSGTDILFIHDATTVTAISVTGSALAATGYELQPLNNLSPSGESVPYHRVRRLSSYWWTANDAGTISVTGTWGWLAIPFQIKEACKVLTKAHLDGRDITSGIVAVTDGGAVSEREARVVRQAITDYSRYDNAGIA